MKPPISAGARGRGRVLVVDHEPEAHAAYQRFLRDEPLELVHAASTATAYELLVAGRFDVALCDVGAGDDGFSFCARVRQNPSLASVAIVLVTPRDGEAEILRGLELGADEFLSKPLRGAELRARVRASLGRRAPVMGIAAPTFEELLRARVDAACARAAISPREREVLDQLLLGRTLEEISGALAITTRTVRFHQANLLAKLGADSRHDLLRLLM